MAGYFGELYLRSTLPFLSEEATRREVEYLERALRDTRGPIVDLACGHARHAGPLNQQGALSGRVLGLELDPLSLAERRPGVDVIRADLRALPFRTSTLGGAYAWYSSLFIFPDAENVRVLEDIARCLKPGGLFVFHSTPYERLAHSPDAAFHHRLPEGGTLEEESHFEAATGRDRAQRTWTSAEGRVLTGSYELRYYPLADLGQMFQKAGFSIRWVLGGLAGEPPRAESTDLIVGAEKRHG